MTMEIRICFNAISKKTVKCETDEKDHFSKDNEHLKSEVLDSGTAYIWRSEYTNGFTHVTYEQKNILNQFTLLPAQKKRNIANMARDFGIDKLLAISDFQSQVITPFFTDNAHALVGAGSTTIETRGANFITLAKKYESALKEVRVAKQSGMPKFNMMALEQKVFNLFKELQVKFQAELQRFMNINKTSRKGTVWSDPVRAVHIAKSSRHSTKLNITSTKEFNKIKYLENSARWIGNGMILLDGYFRAEAVYNDYRKGNDWMRSLSAELASFGVSTTLGIFVGSTLTNILGTMLIFTPYGWVIALGVGLYAGFQASLTVNRITKSITGSIYDRTLPF